MEKGNLAQTISQLGKEKQVRGQSVIEYLVNYAWAMVVIAVVLIVLYLYLSIPAKAVNNTCAFVNGAYCSDIVLGTNATTHATSVALFLTNLQQYPIVNPVVILHVNDQNTSAFKCSPGFVPPGGSIVCIVGLNTNSQVGSLVSGTLYLNATYCGLSVSSYSSTHNCSTGIQQTYVGQFAGHIESLVSTQATLELTATNYTQRATGAIDPLSAQVNLLGYPLSDATVNFTANSTDFYVLPSTTLTNSNGIALSGIVGTTPGEIRVTANYAGLTNSIVIEFTK